MNSIFWKIRNNLKSSASIFLLLLMIFTIESGLLSRQPGTSQLSSLKTNPELSSAISVTTENINDDASKLEAKQVEIRQKYALETEKSIAGIDANLAQLLAGKQFRLLREQLLKLASVAVSENDKNRLGYILNLLGQVSIQEQDVYSAEVYLLEALDIFNKLDDQVGVAQVNLQLGRTHLTSRQIARSAGTAYDELQVGRWYLANNMPAEAIDFINRSIERDLSINRFGSAASAFESLVKLHLKENDLHQAQIAAHESARLFASSGKLDRAHRVLDSLPAEYRTDWLTEQVQSELTANFESYEKGIFQLERAKDYRRLYYFYKNKGDTERAWKFRLLASNSLSAVSKRALFHRQQGVLAILFNSNDDIGLAQDYFHKASTAFETNGLNALSAETRDLNEQVF